MHATCFHCLAELGDAGASADLPAGETVVFDAQRGRVWVVCSTCARWNLAPLADRARTLAAAEALYARMRGRVERQNIGLCRLPDGTTLVRIGAAGAAEVAAWRYGTELRAQRPRSAASRVAQAVGRLVAGTLLSPGVVGRFRIIHVLRDDEDRQVLVRPADLDGAVFRLETGGGRLDVGLVEWGRAAAPRLPAAIGARAAGILLDRMLVSVNREGATPNTLAAALSYLEEHGDNLAGGMADTSASESGGFLRIRYEGEGGWRGEWSPTGEGAYLPVPRHRTLALEIRRQAEAERAATEGELRALEIRWREAEELARIVDEL